MKITLIKPNTNVTAKKELQALIPNLEFDIKDVPLKEVTFNGLSEMNKEVCKVIDSLEDKSIVVSACLVATMLAGGGHEAIERTVNRTKVISSTGALVRAIKNNGWNKVCVIAPYSNEVMGEVINYLKNRNITIVDYINFGQTNNDLVAEISPKQIIHAANSLNYKDAQALVVSACVQMPSLKAMEKIDNGLPLLSALSATANEIKSLLKV